MGTQEQEFEERRLRSYARHFTSLDGLIYDPQNRAQTERVFCISGFVVSVLAQWFFVAAGHVFREIKKPNNRVRSLRAGLWIVPTRRMPKTNSIQPSIWKAQNPNPNSARKAASIMLLCPCTL